MATINLDGDETVLYGPGFQTTVLSPGLGSTARPIAVVTDPAEGDLLVYEDGVFQNQTLVEAIDEALGLAALDSRYVDITGDTMTGDLTISKAAAGVVLTNTTAGTNAKQWQWVTTNTPRLAWRTRDDSNLAGHEFFTATRSGTTVTSVALNDDGLDMDVRIEGDTATSLLVTDAGLDAVQIGDTTAGVIADFRATGVVFNEDGSDRTFRVEGDTATQLLVAQGTGDAVRIGTTVAGAIAEFFPSTITLNESGADLDVRIEGDTATNLLVTDAGLDAVRIGTTVTGVIADFRSTAITFNENGADRDFRVEGDTDTEVLFVDASADFVGIGTTAPTAKLDIDSDVLRLRTAKTPASAGATGNAGDIAWDSGFFYVCIATNTWRRVAHATW